MPLGTKSSAGSVNFFASLAAGQGAILAYSPNGSHILPIKTGRFVWHFIGPAFSQPARVYSAEHLQRAFRHSPTTVSNLSLRQWNPRHPVREFRPDAPLAIPFVAGGLVSVPITISFNVYWDQEEAVISRGRLGVPALPRKSNLVWLRPGLAESTLYGKSRIQLSFLHARKRSPTASLS